MLMATCKETYGGSGSKKLRERKVTGPVVYKHPLNRFIVLSVNGSRETFHHTLIEKIWTV